jgi:hypothetical protein
MIQFGGEDGSLAVETARGVKACRSLAAGEALPRYCHGRPTVQGGTPGDRRTHNPPGWFNSSAPPFFFHRARC